MKARSYLRQIAAPVLLNEPVLMARRTPHAPAIPQADFPVLVERDSTEESAPKPQKRPVAQPPMPEPTKTHSSRPLPAEAVREVPARVADAVLSTYKHLPAEPKIQRQRISSVDSQQNPSQEIATATQALPEGRGAQLNGTADNSIVSDVLQYPNEYSKGVLAALPESAKPAAVTVMEGYENPAVSAGEPFVKTESTLFRSDSKSAPRQRLPWPENRRREQRRVRSATQVRIGTVEVHNIVSPAGEPRPAQAVLQPAAQRVLSRSASSAATEPLARPLAWSFGLVQG